MKKYIFLFLLVCFCNSVQAQSTFEKVIDTLGCAYAKCVKQTYDGGFIVCGTSSYNGNDAAVVKLDSTGVIEWAKIFTGPGVEAAQYVAQTPDSGYIVDAIYDDGLNAKNWLLRLDANGDTLWTKILSVGAGATLAYQMAVSNSGNYGLAGYHYLPATGDYDAYLIITGDTTANPISKVYTSTYGSTGYGVAITYNNGFAITGEYDVSASDANVYLIRIDSIGDTLWTRSYGNAAGNVGFALEKTTDSGFIIAGITWNTSTGKYNVYLIKTEQNGDTLWTKQFGGFTSCGALSVNKTTDGGYIVTGNIVNGNPLQTDVYLMKTNAHGDTLWTRQFDNSQQDIGYYVRQTKDGGYIIAGLQSSINPGFYLIKTDSMGMVTTGTGIAEVNNQFVFTVFPNPSTGNFTVQLKGIPYNSAVVEIYNLNNQSIYSCPVYKKSTLEVDLSNYSGGMYVVTLKTKEKIYLQKIIIQK